MAEFDKALDAEGRIADFIAAQIHQLRRFPGNEHNYPGDVQAAQLMIDMVIPLDTSTVRTDDALYGLAVDVADAIEQRRWGATWRNMNWNDLAEALRGWAAGVEAEQNDPENEPVEEGVREKIIAAVGLAWKDAAPAARDAATKAVADDFGGLDDDAEGLPELHHFAGLTDEAKAEYLRRVVGTDADVAPIMAEMKRHNWPRQGD